MTKSDMRLRDILLALVLLTRLPLPRLPDSAFARQAKAAWAYPLAGLAVALPACVLGALALAAGLPAGPAAGLVMTVQVLLTGAMHEDGLADVADGFWGGFTRERRLEIMKDSRIGAYGVLALVLILILRWSALTALIGAGGIWALAGVAAPSRAPMAVLMACRWRGACRRGAGRRLRAAVCRGGRVCRHSRNRPGSGRDGGCGAGQDRRADR